MPGRELRPAALLLSLTAATTTLPAAAQGPPQDSGTMVTIAGPNGCRGTAAADRASTHVRSLAVDAAGRIYVETGPPDAPVLAKVGDDGQARLVATGTTGRWPASAGLAPDGAGGVLLAAEGLLVDVLSSEAPLPLAGRPGSQTRFPSFHGDIESLAADGSGPVFVAELTGGPSPSIQVRALNRSPQPVTFFAGSPWHIDVAPGSTAVVAGGGPGRAGGEAAVDLWVDAGSASLAVAGSRLYLAWHRAPSRGSPGSSGVRLVNLGSTALTAHGQRVEPGMSAVVAGGGRPGFGGDGGPATKARFSVIRGMAAGPDGVLLLADEENHRIRRVDAAGEVATIAGTGGVGARAGGFDGNDQPASAARLNRPFDVEIGPRGWIYVSDQLNGQVRYVDGAGVIRAAPGNGLGRSWLCADQDGSPTRAQDRIQPAAVVADPLGGVLFVDGAASQVRHVDGAGPITPVAAARSAADCLFGGSCPALATGPEGVLYVRDGTDGSITVVNRGGGPASVHGTTVPAGESRALPNPLGPGPLASDGRGSLVVADRFKGSVQRIGADGAVTDLVVPPGGAVVEGCCVQPAGLAFDRRGNLYVADAFPGGRIWLLNLSQEPLEAHGKSVAPGHWVAVAARGDLERGFSGDGGPGLEARFRLPSALAADPAGNLYVADFGENTVRRLDPQGVITTVAGTGTFGFNGDHLDAALSMLFGPAAVAVDPCGDLLIADLGNNRVRRVNLSPSCRAGTPAGRADAGSSMAPWAVGALALVATAAVLAAGSRRPPGRRPPRPVR